MGYREVVPIQTGAAPSTAKVSSNHTVVTTVSRRYTFQSVYLLNFLRPSQKYFFSAIKNQYSIVDAKFTN